MGDTTITIIAIFLAGILLFIVPMMTMADRNDDISQLAVQTSTVEFVDKVRTKGVLTLEDYEQFMQELTATGNSYTINLEIRRMDENPAKKTVQTITDKIGENVSYSEYTSQILQTLQDKGKIALREGDFILVSTENDSVTLSQQFKNFLYKVTGNDTYQIAAQHSGLVTVNGTGASQGTE